MLMLNDIKVHIERLITFVIRNKFFHDIIMLNKTVRN